MIRSGLILRLVPANEIIRLQKRLQPNHRSPGFLIDKTGNQNQNQHSESLHLRRMLAGSKKVFIDTAQQPSCSIVQGIYINTYKKQLCGLMRKYQLPGVYSERGK